MRLKSKGIVVDDKMIYIYAEPMFLPRIRKHFGSVKVNEDKGYLQVYLSRTNLIRIGKIFNPVPNVVKGQEYIDKYKDAVRKWYEQGDSIRKIIAKEGTMRSGEEQLIVPHSYVFKVPPRDHQHRTFMALDVCDQLNVMADCGTGKTFILLTSTEYKLQKGRVSKGKTLVSGPLSVLTAAWIEDAEKFTNLKVGLLWTDKGTKEVLGEKITVRDFGPKPDYCIGNRNKKIKQWRNKKNPDIVKEKLTPFDKAVDWEEMVCHWRESKNSQTDEWMPYGKMYARTRSTVSRKRLHIEEMLKDPSYDIFVINHDGVRIHQDILAAHGFEQFIVDESTKIKNHNSRVYRAHVKIARTCKYRYPMSGTPAPNGAYDLWAQFFFADRGMTLEPSVKDFREQFFDEVILNTVSTDEKDDGDSIKGGLKQIKKYIPKSPEHINEIAKRLMYGSVRFRQDECLDLPKRQNFPVPVRMSAEQTRAYLKMEQDLIAEFTDVNGSRQVIEASVMMVKMLRLRQITSGFASAQEKIDDDSNYHLGMSINDSAPKVITEFPENPKMDALESLLEQIGENKMVVITNYQYEIDMICKKFADFNPMFIDGRTKGKDRPEIITKFQKDPNYRLIVLHPAAAGHGITLTAARYMTFFSMTNNYEHEYQTAKRIERFGQQHEMTMYYLMGQLDPTVFKEQDAEYLPDQLQTVDHALYELIREKENIQELLIDQKPVKDFDFKEAATNEIFEQILRRQDYVERIDDRREGQNMEEPVHIQDGLL